MRVALKAGAVSVAVKDFDEFSFGAFWTLFFLKVSLGFKNISFPLPLLPLKTVRIWSATQNAFKTHRHKVAAAAEEEEEEEEEKNGTFFCGAKNKSDANGRGPRVSDVRAPVAKRRGRRFAARRFVLLGRFLLWCRERKKKNRAPWTNATGGGRCDRDLGTRKRFRGEWSSDEENDAVVVAERWGGGVPTRRIPMPFFLFRLGLSLLGNRGEGV